MSIAAFPSLSMLPTEVLFAIFKRLDRHSKLSLGLTGPHFLHLLASYYDLDRYRRDEQRWEKIGLPTGVSWDESAAQPTIIRWLSASGCDDIDNPPQVVEEEEYPVDEPKDIWSPCLVHEPELPPPYEETEGGKADMMVESIISRWLREKFGIRAGCIICAECYRYMLVLGRDGKITPWSKNMLTRPM